MKLSLSTACVVVLGQALVFALAGCHTNLDPDNSPNNGDKMTLCTEPRPQICTHEYLPVCAKFQDGSHKTYATGCTACSDPRVVGYVPEPCTDDK